MQMVSLRSACPDISIDIHIDFFRPSVDLKVTRSEVTRAQNLTLSVRDHRTYLHVSHIRIAHACFDASRPEKHDDVRVFALVFFVQKLFTKSHMAGVVDSSSEVNS